MITPLITQRRRPDRWHRLVARTCNEAVFPDIDAVPTAPRYSRRLKARRRLRYGRRHAPPLDRPRPRRPSGGVTGGGLDFGGPGTVRNRRRTDAGLYLHPRPPRLPAARL